MCEYKQNNVQETAYTENGELSQDTLDNGMIKYSSMQLRKPTAYKNIRKNVWNYKKLDKALKSGKSI